MLRQLPLAEQMAAVDPGRATPAQSSPSAAPVQFMTTGEKSGFAEAVSRVGKNGDTATFDPALKQRLKSFESLWNATDLRQLSSGGELSKKLGRAAGEDQEAVSQNLAELESALYRLTSRGNHLIGELTVGVDLTDELSDGKEFDADNLIVQGTLRIIVETKDTDNAFLQKLKSGTQHSRLTAWVRGGKDRAVQYFVNQSEKKFDEILDDSVINDMASLESAMTDQGTIGAVDHSICVQGHRFFSKDLKDLQKEAFKFLGAYKKDHKKANLNDVADTYFGSVANAKSNAASGYDPTKHP